MTQLDVDLVPVIARPHPARLSKALYPVTGRVTTRYGDVDANGHVNNLALESAHENARAELNQVTFPGVYQPAVRSVRLVTANNAVHFLAEVFWPATIETGLGIGRLGRTSFTVSTALFVADRCVSVCDTVLVVLDDYGPAPIPEEARDRMSSLLLNP